MICRAVKFSARMLRACVLIVPISAEGIFGQCRDFSTERAAVVEPAMLGDVPITGSRNTVNRRAEAGIDMFSVEK